jgi:acyl-CoA synthetase (AMP-forming)/AMP-acid ligase II
MSQIRPIPRDGNPFPGHGVWVDEHSMRHYDNIPATLLDSLQRWADRTPDAEALAELGGERLTYRQLRDRAARVDVDAVIAHVSALIADFKVPQYLTVWDGPLPRNPGGKILKAHLRQQVEWGEPLR